MKISQNDVVASPRILNRQLILTFCHKDSPYSQQYGWTWLWQNWFIGAQKEGYYDKITKVVFDASLEGFQPQWLAGMFRGMTRLETAEGLGLLNTSRLISLQETFYDCTNLIELDLSRFCTPKVQGMEKMFCNCKKLKRLDLRGFDLAVIRDMRSMFEGCCSLEEIYIDADRFGLILFSAVKVNKLFQDSNPSGVIYEMRRRKDDGPTEWYEADRMSIETFWKIQELVHAKD